MIDQFQLFDAQEAQELRERGMTVAINADRVTMWKVKADDWLTRKPSGFVFTSDDLTYSIGVPDEGQNRNNVVGAYIAGWSKRKLIIPTGQFIKSKRTTCHGAVQREWSVK